ncbi:LLM class flavin-dependent oxidoreductase [Hypericibacter sp.]|uniref:LLM class flavin-dependent oxidoreductase n=1 Tax=Hypericibacter sp. TaxID=2705401 RepID=UPI003D6CA2F7
MIPFSVLDLSPICVGGTAADAFRNSADLARHAERWGYKRYWLAEHHNMPGIASAATSIVIAHVAAATKTIRVGSGGIMLPNHAPLVIAEQFGTLESLFPGRIDLGLGRAPGTDQRTAWALRRNMTASDDQFPRDVMELQQLLGPAEPGQTVSAVPGIGLKIPIWLLGSSLFSAQLSAILGLPFAFASHFAPDLMMQALDIYRSQFQPSATLEKPYAMLGLNIFAAETDAGARRLFTSLQQQFVNLRRGHPTPLQPPLEGEGHWSAMEQAGIDRSLAEAVVGSRDTVRRGLDAFLAKTEADEIMITAQIYDHQARLRSFEIVSEIRDQMGSARPAKAAAGA